MGEVRSCFSRELGQDTKLAGRVTAMWAIDAEGSVAAVAVKDEIPPVGACVSNVIEGLRFKEPRGGGVVFVTYPFVFRQEVAH